jgi:hypothetical protein
VNRLLAENNFQAEALDVEHDAFVCVFFYAQDAACEIGFVGPEVHEGILAFDAEFEMQSGSFG